VKLLLKVITKNVPEASTTFHHFTDSTVCNQEGENCMLSKGKNCANVFLREKYSLNDELLKQRMKFE
jgi:hypothetical protein